MPTSFLIAQIAGTYLVVTGLALALNITHFKKVLKSLNKYKPTVLLLSIVLLILGLMLITIHNIWENNFRGVITVLGWVMVVKAIAFLFFTEKMTKLTQGFASPDILKLFATAHVILGVYLAYFGFFG